MRTVIPGATRSIAAIVAPMMQRIHWDLHLVNEARAVRARRASSALHVMAENMTDAITQLVTQPTSTR
jgi:hypothetical protein